MPHITAFAYLYSCLGCLLKTVILKIIPTFLLFALLPLSCFSQKTNDTLVGIKVFSTISNTKLANPIPTQVLGRSDLANSLSIADALKQLAGVFVKDYGGVGGLKTVSVRSLGANHTAVLYDGLILGEAQGGQTDLGKLSIDNNIDQVQLSNSSAIEILLPARAFASASLITIKNNNPILLKNEKNALQIKLQQGSFGYYATAISYKTILNKKIQTSLHALVQYSKSDYPFKSYENNQTIEKRKNSDIKTQKIEYDLLFNKNIRNTIKLKAYWYHSNRGLPGAIIFYNATSTQRLNDNNLFVQSTWKHLLSSKSHLLVSAKYSAEDNIYFDPTYPNSIGRLENEFHQQEIYSSAAFSTMLSKALSISISSDVFKSKLSRTDIFVSNFAEPTRNTFLQNVAFTLKKTAFEIQGNLLYTSINEKVKFGNTAKNFHQFTPALAASVRPFLKKNLYLRAFYKNIFRAPTFNDLYYTNIGNTNLLPEFAQQLNVGLSYYKKNEGLINQFSVTIDAYANSIKDKILAVPRQNLFQWSMQNIATVKIKGIDITAHAGILDYKGYKIFTKISYTLQQAVDLSDETSLSYKTQLPYTPMHSANATFSIQNKKIIFIYNFFLSSYKYTQGAEIAENLIQGYSSSDISLAYMLNDKYKIITEAINIFNTQYEVIRFYPMPRFNYRLTFQISLKKQTKV
jgi:vitamin B12 transporter